MNVEKFTYRPDIDGLRAIAVLLVLVFHAFPAVLPGGFIGVDVFFVVSGYLITSIILKEAGAGRWSYLNFYKRRILRLFPALLIVLACCYAVGWNSLFANEFKMFGKHLMASAGFFVNYTYWLESGYFDAASEKKILLHLWSLSVEEQFYLIWPIFLITAIQLKRVQSWTRWILIISMAIGWMLIFVDKSFLYFSVISRFWELSAGGYLGYQQYLNHRAPKHFSTLNSNALGTVSFSGLLLCAWLYSSDFAFPGLWGVVPVLAVIVLISEASAGSVVRKFLSFQPLVYVGLISYPLYLWHWPVLSFLGYIDPVSGSAAHRVLALAASFVLAVLTYELMERPIKNMRSRPQQIVAVILSLGMILIGYIGFNTYSRNGLAFREAHSIRELTSQQVQRTDDCLSFFPSFKLTFCRSSDAVEKTDVLLFGDSHAHQYFTGLSNEYAKINQHVLNVGWAGHPPVIQDNPSRVHQSQMPFLIDHLLEKIHFHTVILSMAQPDSVSPETAQGLSEVIDKFRAAGKTVIYIQDNPHLPFHPIDCVGMPPLRPMKNPTCEFSLARLAPSFFETRKQLATLLEEQQVMTYDYLNLLCSNGRCKIREKDLLLYETDGYISQPASPMLLKNFPFETR